MTFVVQASQVPTGSMENTMLVGDFLLVNKLAYANPGNGLEKRSFPGRTSAGTTSWYSSLWRNPGRTW